jgi:hypothetical protein
MILMRANPLQGLGWALKIETFVGPEMAMSGASALVLYLPPSTFGKRNHCDKKNHTMYHTYEEDGFFPGIVLGQPATHR